jgi:hypothetical protein
MKRYLGIDLHTNSFTCCYLHADGSETIRTWPLQGGGLEQFIKGLHAGDDVALEATGNAAYFCKTVEPFVARVVVIAPWQFEVIRRSVKKTDAHDARAIALFLSKDMLPEARIKSEAHVQLASLITTRDQPCPVCMLSRLCVEPVLAKPLVKTDAERKRETCRLGTGRLARVTKSWKVRTREW